MDSYGPVWVARGWIPRTGVFRWPVHLVDGDEPLLLLRRPNSRRARAPRRYQRPVPVRSSPRIHGCDCQHGVQPVRAGLMGFRRTGCAVHRTGSPAHDVRRRVPTQRARGIHCVRRSNAVSPFSLCVVGNENRNNSPPVLGIDQTEPSEWQEDSTENSLELITLRQAGCAFYPLEPSPQDDARRSRPKRPFFSSQSAYTSSYRCEAPRKSSCPSRPRTAGKASAAAAGQRRR